MRGSDGDRYYAAGTRPGGDGGAFRELTDPYRRELHVHCYRILGSVQDTEDVLQETLLAAWRGLGRFEERASLRSWLCTIATNRCLNFLRDTGRRPEGLTLAGDKICAITRFGDNSLLSHFGLPRTLPG